MTVIYVKCILAIAAGFFAGLAAVYIFNRMPASWLCDYGRTPSQELSDPYVQRVKGWPWRWIYAGGLACLCLRMAFSDIHHMPSGLQQLQPDLAQLLAQGQLAAAGLFACWAMLILGLADLKYMILPDQFVVVLAASSLGFLPFHENLWQPLGGMAIGGGVMLLIALLGAAASGKEVLGFGDVKLCAAMGLALGIYGMIFTLAAASIGSGIAAATALARRKAHVNDRRPLGPWLCGAAITYIFIIWPWIV